MAKTTMSSFELDGRVAVVTGGSRGIGRAIALGLADAGADVVVASRGQQACDDVASEIRGRGRRAVGVACDAASAGDVARLFEQGARELGPCQIFVHSAGLSSVGSALEADREELQRMLSVHYLGAVDAAQHAARQMMEAGGGAILLVTSVWGLGGNPSQLAYGAAKAALAHAVKVMALEWARHGIRVNGLAPGLVETDMTGTLPPDARDKLLKRIPMRRVADPAEMAGPGLFLCSDAASYVTGHVLVADGGERAR